MAWSPQTPARLAPSAMPSCESRLSPYGVFVRPRPQAVKDAAPAQWRGVTTPDNASRLPCRRSVPARLYERGRRSRNRPDSYRSPWNLDVVAF